MIVLGIGVLLVGLVGLVACAWALRADLRREWDAWRDLDRRWRCPEGKLATEVCETCGRR